MAVLPILNSYCHFFSFQAQSYSCPKPGRLQCLHLPARCELSLQSCSFLPLAEPGARSQGRLCILTALTAHQTPAHAFFSSCLVHYTIAKTYKYFLCLIFFLFQKILYLFHRKRLALFDQNLWMSEPGFCLL